MTRGRQAWARLAAPAAFLLAATIAVLLVRAGLSGSGGGTTTVPSVPTRPATVASTATTTTGATVTSPSKRRFYTLQSGDTLGSVAARFGTSVQALLELNPGIQPTSLHVGQRIRVG